MLTCNKEAHFFFLGLICFLKLMGMGYRHIAIKLKFFNAPKRKFCVFCSNEVHFYRFGGNPFY
ncbi:hypothetical protein COE15_05265 [Bacillus cereus]|nr:hypothetical protein CN288_05250 [Bacillus sp. AFS023182]PGY03726.1 hypothetical protein COE15_05265 [Bacillus cereus]